MQHTSLADRLINQMGFEALDVASMLVQQSSLPLFDGNQPQTPIKSSGIATNFRAAIPPSPELASAPGVQIQTIAGEDQVVVTGHIGDELAALMLAEVRGAKQEQVRGVAQHNALVAAQESPAARGERFAPLPTLGYRSDAQGKLWPLEREAVLETVELDLLSPEAIDLQGFQVTQQSPPSK